MSKIIFLIAIMLSVVGIASAQTEADLKQYFEGQHVTLKLDMPATKDGVNVYPERAPAFDYSEYAARLKRHGTSIRRGDSIMITKIKVKDKHIEFQLGGGGYGTFGDETDSSGSVPSAAKSRREKNLEAELKRETDPARRKRLREELADLRREREREDRINRALAAEAEEARRARVEQKALQGGSRFNVHFDLIDGRTLTPSALIAALSRYVDFSELEADTPSVSLSQPTVYEHIGAGGAESSVVRLGPATTYLSEGLSTREVLRLLGQPLSISTRQEQGIVVTTYEFPRGAGRKFIAEFVNDALVHSRIETQGQVAEKNRFGN